MVDGSSHDQSLAHQKPQIVRCKKCRRFLCEVNVEMERPYIGKIARIHKLKCSHCKHVNSVTMGFVDRPDESESAKAKAAN